MPTENGPTWPDRPGKPERARRRVAIKVAFIFATAAAAGFVAWVVYQLHCFHVEQQARAALEADSGADAIVGGPTAEEAPYLTLSELRHGRLYVPIVHVSIGRLLRTLKLDRNGWHQLQAFRYLERLEISKCTPEPNLNADFSGFTHLKSLAVAETPFSAQEIRTLARLPELQDAVFEKKHGIDEWLPGIGQLRHLRTLEIQGDVSDQAVGSLVGLGALERLFLDSDRLTSNVVPALARLMSLKGLILSHTRIDDKGLRQLAALKGLTGLHLVGNDCISDEGVGFLAALESLETLTLDSNRITSQSVPILARLKKLKYLVLAKTQIDDEGLRRLTELKELEALDLQGTRVAEVGGDLRYPALAFLDLVSKLLTSPIRTLALQLM